MARLFLQRLQPVGNQRHDLAGAERVIAVATARYIQRSWIGRGLRAVRDDELAAECTGVPTLQLKLVACTISGALMSAIGAPAAMYLQYADPASAFNLNYSVSALAMALIGGTAHWIGPILGALLLSVTQQLLTVTISSEVNVLVLGLMLVLFVVGAPDGISQLFFFLSPDCPVCKTLLPIVNSIAHAERDWLRVILASDGGDADKHREFQRREKLDAFPYVLSETLGRSFGVGKLPYAVLIDGDRKVASMGLVNSREHLESLFEAKERGIASLQEFAARRAVGAHDHKQRIGA
mgnify:CR=1 FL=1